MHSAEGFDQAVSGLGGSGFHPAIGKHFQQDGASPRGVCPFMVALDARSEPQGTADTADEAMEYGGSGCHPLVAKHLEAQTTLGGGGYHPAVAKHLRGG